MPLRTNGSEIRSRRELRGLTVSEFAKTVGYHPNWVSQIELGNVNGGPKFCAAAAHALRCEVADITSGHIPYGDVARDLERTE